MKLLHNLLEKLPNDIKAIIDIYKTDESDGTCRIFRDLVSLLK